MPKMNRFSSPASSAISTLAPSMVPMVRAPFNMNFMFPVPDASVPAVEICSDRSVAGTERISPCYPVRESVICDELSSRESLSDVKLLNHSGTYIEVDLVDLIDDLQVSGQQRLQQLHRPTLQSLGQHSVVGVGEVQYHDLGVDPFGAVSRLLHSSVEVNWQHVLGPGFLPGVSMSQPIVCLLYLQQGEVQVSIEALLQLGHILHSTIPLMLICLRFSWSVRGVAMTIQKIHMS
ncbi:hypothetical protein INR49_013083 [Caranx melampygus]|nr:hypothetical protein INR49_013083 [Caranx melampygus]